MNSPETADSGHTQWQQLEARISRIEKHLGFSPLESIAVQPASSEIEAAPSPDEFDDQASQLEESIGEFGLAWVGSTVFFLGVVFLITYASGLGYRIASTAIGYLAAAGFFFAARIWKTRYAHLSRILVSASVLLAFYTTMKLNFFSAAPLIESPLLVLVLLLAVVVLQFQLAINSGSQVMTSVGVLLAIIASLLVDRTHIELPLIAAISAVSVWLAISKNWWRQLYATVILTYLAHLLWLLSDPVAGNSVHAVPEHQYNIVYLFVYAAIFSVPLLLRKPRPSDSTLLGVTILNCFGFAFVVFLAALTHFQKNFHPIAFVACALLLGCSAVQFLRTSWSLGAAIYACLGFLALSIAIYGSAGLPDSFLWLSVQSLVVVSIALWFRSKFLVVVNSLIYIGILIIYFAFSPSSHPVNFSFSLVALASARVMNWQRERLTLRTDILRNVYLSVAFVLIFFALYRAVPGQYVTLSWTMTALAYFLMSYLLKSIKYRLMGIAAIIVTVVYLFVVDLAQLDPGFRVISFLVLGLMVVMISLYYTRIRRTLHRS